jgi:hypothetical protein
VTDVTQALRAEGGLVAAALGPAGADDELAAGLAPARAFAVAAVREGWRLHGGDVPRIVTGADPDLGLLAGDRLYALGLERLAREGDVEAVAVLAEAIAACARASAEAAPERAGAAWERAARSLAPPR